MTEVSATTFIADSPGPPRPGRSDGVAVPDRLLWEVTRRADSRGVPSTLLAARAAIDRGDVPEAERRLMALQGGWSQVCLPFADLYLDGGRADGPAEGI
ncbi:hypothetical protein ACIBI9_40310 [Nonomuraea sp. NPDC050451]|uniref:hypothetical protein n=1 Tax=Nonomuraea sp. NPDC050451 TaxID=3364364 RepID=UPI00379317BA